MSATKENKSSEYLVEVKDMKKWFPVQKNFIDQVFARELEYVHAVDGVSFKIRKGEVLGLAGESGSGKTTIGRVTIGLEPKTSGDVYFDGIDLSTLSREELRKLRRRMQVIFQDPLASLNPRMSLGESIMQGLKIHYPETAPSDPTKAHAH